MLAGALASLTVATLFGLAPISGFKPVFDNVIGGEPLPTWLPNWLPVPTEPRMLLTVVAAAMVLLAVISVGLGVWSRWHTTRITHRVRVAVRRRVFEHAVDLPLHRVYALKSGGVASMLREDAGGVADLIFAMLYNPWKAVVQLVTCLAILTIVDWRLLLGSLVILPVVYITHKAWISRIRPLWRDIRASRQFIDSTATEAFGGMRVVRTFSRQRSETAAFTTSNHFMTRQELYAWWWNRGVDIAWALLIPLATAGVLWYGGMRILEDRALVEAGQLAPNKALTVGDLVMFLGYLGSLLAPLATLAQSATSFQNSLAGLDRVLDLLDEQVEMPDRPGAIDVNPKTTAGRITIENLSFAYPGTQTPALRDINLDALAGQTVAFVGPSGAGKSTLCNLIARFYDPDEGNIQLDGTDLRDINVRSYRTLLGIVEQDIFLFDGTVADNIAYGRRGASRQQIHEAAKLANAHDFILELPDGYDTHIGERGVKLSGGQRQRLAIARALLADPKILILDEATSNLDTESERLIQASLRELMADRTCFVIAHRLSTIIHADQIVVIDHGQVIEHGRHDELMARSGRYRHMIHQQLQGPDAEAIESINQPASSSSS